MKKASISPTPTAFGGTPSALERTQSTDRQVRFDENTIIWGDRDDLPLRIMDAVNSSPTTTSCLSTLENFIAGSGFEDPELMKMVIDKEGTTLWDFHLQLVPYMTLLESFAVNFQFDRKGRITNSYVVGAESCRFVKPIGKKIFAIKHNPYFGTAEYKAELTTEYPVFDIASIKDQVNILGDNFNGQIYFWGTVRPPYKFYSVPKYWSGEKWIYVDAGIQQFHKENMDNGFFQSTLMNIIGDPNQKSKNPAYMKSVTQTDGTTKLVSGKTIGEEFNDQMTKTFSGTRKAGTAMVLWSLNEQQAPKITAFPVNSQFDVLAGTYNDAIKGICTATGVDPILLSIQNNGLANAGDSVKAVIEYTQSKVKRQQSILENFYNTVMLPNLQVKTDSRVKLMNYVPITTSVTVEDKFWDVLSDSQKKAFVNKKVNGISELGAVEEIKKEEASPETLQAQAALRGSVGGVQGVLQIQQGVGAKTTTPESAISILTIIYGFSLVEAYRLLGQPIDETTGQPITQPTIPKNDEMTDEAKSEIPINDNLKNMTGKQQQQFLRIIKQYGQSKLTEEQAKVMLRSGFGFTEDEITSILAI